MNELPYDEGSVPQVSSSLRRLARSLVGDGPQADDLVQDAWVAALQAPRGRVRDWGHWLRGVVVRSAAQERRRARTRREHERGSARPAWLESERGLAERLSSARLLVEGVEALDDPYRSVLRLHYFEELELEQVAQRLGRPLSTVKTWKSRGLVRLREALDRRTRGDRSAWTSALTPLLRRGQRVAPSAAGAGLRALAGLAVLSTVLAVWILRARTAEPMSEPAAPSVAVAAPPSEPLESTGRRPLPAGTRSVAGSAAPPASTAPARPSPSRRPRPSRSDPCWGPGCA